MFRNNVLTTRRETTDVWQIQNPVLNEMELGVEIILNSDRKVSYYNIKLGDGDTTWNSLGYFYQNLNEEDTNEILDDFTFNLATRKPVADRIPIYNDGKGLKSGKVPTENDDVVRLSDVSTVIDATDTPAPNKVVKYNKDAGLKSNKTPTENNDVIRFLEFNNEVSDINSKISTLNGAYYVLDAYNFGKSLNETDPDDILLLNTYAIANTPGASSMADVYNDTVIINEFDTSEFVYNKISELWVKYPNGYLTIATNDHLGVVKGTPSPTDPTDESKNTFIQVLADGAMKLVGDRIGKVDVLVSRASTYLSSEAVVNFYDIVYSRGNFQFQEYSDSIFAVKTGDVFTIELPWIEFSGTTDLSSIVHFFNDDMEETSLIWKSNRNVQSGGNFSTLNFVCIEDGFCEISAGVSYQVSNYHFNDTQYAYIFRSRAE
jgi:hypothetical protein